MALTDLSRFEEAEAAYRRSIELDPGLTRARFNLAIALKGQARLAEAENAYRTVIASDLAYRGVWLNLGNLLADQNKLDEAVVAYRRAFAAHADDPGLLGNLSNHATVPAAQAPGMGERPDARIRRACAYDRTPAVTGCARTRLEGL